MGIDDIKRFLAKDIWRVRREDVSALRYFFYTLAKDLLLAIKFFTTRRIMDMAAALTYSTLLAIVPILAVVFAIARGFGYSKYIEVWFREALSSQPQAADSIIGFVNSYLIHTRSGIFLGIGLLFMLWTVLMLTSNIEKTFNHIWQVKRPRTIFRTITDYLAMFFLTPIVIVVTSGVSIVLATLAGEIEELFVLGPIMRVAMAALPYVLMSAVFTLLYVFMPNTKVRLKSAIVPGILAGVAMQVLQLFYIHAQLFLSSYNAIYGSFAALPLFMLWVQISWTICLFGAELCYTSQNLEDFAFLTKTEDISHRYRLTLCALLLSRICRRFDEGKRPYTALQLKTETGIPIRVIHDLLYVLSQAGLVVENAGFDNEEEPVYQPAMSIEHITIGAMVDRLESMGKWPLDVDLRQLIHDAVGKEIGAARRHYLDDLRKIQLKDL